MSAVTLLIRNPSKTSIPILGGAAPVESAKANARLSKTSAEIRRKFRMFNLLIPLSHASLGLVLRQFENDTVRSRHVGIRETGRLMDGFAQDADAGGRQLFDRGAEVRDAKAEMGDAETMTIRPIASDGRSRRGDVTGKTTEDEDLPAECQKDSEISIRVRVAMDRLCLEVALIELCRLLWLGRIDVDVIEGFDFQGTGPALGRRRSPKRGPEWDNDASIGTGLPCRYLGDTEKGPSFPTRYSPLLPARLEGLRDLLRTAIVDRGLAICS